MAAIKSVFWLIVFVGAVIGFFLFELPIMASLVLALFQ